MNVQDLNSTAVKSNGYPGSVSVKFYSRLIEH